jgi:hypothetical protein
MKEKLFRTRAWGNLVLIALMGAAWQIQAQDAKAEDKTYASIAPIDQYLMADRNAEIALARSAAPKSISADATILVLDRWWSDGSAAPVM